MRWFLKWIMALPKATLEFRKEYNLSRKCQKIEKKEGVIAGGIYMYDKVIDVVKPVLIEGLLEYIQEEEYVEPNPIYNRWMIMKGIEYGFIKPVCVPEEKPEVEDWKAWEMQE